MRHVAVFVIAGGILAVAGPGAAEQAWRVRSGVLLPGPQGSWDDTRVDAPFVLREGDALRMWYRGCQLLGGDGIEWSCAVGHARSRDGVRWERSPEPVLRHLGARGEERIVSLALARDGEGGLLLWYAVRDAWAGGPCVIHAAASPDGLHFAPRGAALRVHGFRGCPLAALRDAGRIHLWVADRDGDVPALHHLVSDDGEAWTRRGAWPFLAAAPALGPLAVSRTEGGFRALYARGAGAPGDPAFGRLASSDGADWTRLDGGSPPRAALGEARWASHVALGPDADGRRLWFAARPATDAFVPHFGGIGLAATGPEP